MNRILKIPKFLHELHGEEATLLSILLVYCTGLVFAAFSLIMSPGFHHGYLKWVLAAMALDIGGGVVATITAGTSAYYAKRPAARWIFIVVHVIHPVILWMIFSYMNGILIIGGTTLVFTAVVNAISGKSNQRMVSVSLFTLNLVLLNLLVTGLMPAILLSVFSMKLIVGFGVKWSSPDVMP